MSSRNYGPVVQRARLTRELQALRHSREETQEAVAESVGWSVSKYIRVEAGTVRVTDADLEYLLRKHYGITDQGQMDALVQLARDARAKGWWDKHTITDRAFQAYLGYEAGARTIRVSQGLVPGLLQTDGYMRALAAAHLRRPQDIDALVALRKERQKAIKARKIGQIYLLHEQALRIQVGDSNAMRDQLLHLIEVAKEPEITLRVIPDSAGAHFGLKGPFVILSFDPETGLDDVLYLESARRGDLIMGPGEQAVSGQPEDAAAAQVDDIAGYYEGFESELKVALEAQETIEFIERRVREMSR